MASAKKAIAPAVAAMAVAAVMAVGEVAQAGEARPLISAQAARRRQTQHTSLRISRPRRLLARVGFPSDGSLGLDELACSEWQHPHLRQQPLSLQW